ncbi:MAG TPA: phage holin family protein [Thermoanaerobaculia bacterium]|jgi:hypothetical protein
MSSESDRLPDEEEERSWRDRLTGLIDVTQALLQTRVAIFREEMGEKALFASKGLVAMAVAGALGVGALLLLAALLAALFAALFKSVVLGILAALIVYGAGAGLAGFLGWRALSRVRPLEFHATSEELASDWEAVRSSLHPEPEEALAPVAGGDEGREIEDLEKRFRSGAE